MLTLARVGGAHVCVCARVRVHVRMCVCAHACSLALRAFCGAAPRPSQGPPLRRAAAQYQLHYDDVPPRNISILYIPTIIWTRIMRIIDRHTLIRIRKAQRFHVADFDRVEPAHGILKAVTGLRV